MGGEAAWKFESNDRPRIGHADVPKIGGASKRLRSSNVGERMVRKEITARSRPSFRIDAERRRTKHAADGAHSVRHPVR